MKFIAVIFFIIVTSGAIYGLLKPLPEGISTGGELRYTSNIEFLYDLTYQKEGQQVKEQFIFNKVFELIEEAEQFIVIDMFLLNDDYDRNYRFPQLSSQLVDALIDKKKARPEVDIAVITDEINTFYGAYPSKHLENLKSNGIDVIITDLNKLRDPNPAYSGVWRPFLQWFGTGGKGWVQNAFSPDSSKVTVRAYLKLVNFKANHRKVVLTDKNALVTSANPHDASANHSNMAFVIDGKAITDLVQAEKAVAVFSGGDLPYSFDDEAKALTSGTAQVSVLTERKIRDHLLDSIGKTKKGDKIWVGMFYLSDRKVIGELLSASQRGVDIKLVLDPNKDAFGLEKNGIPNRPVAFELVEKSKGAIKVRWYDTHGEQYHTKMVMIQGKESSVIYGGSANLTRRNLGDFNLETDLKIIAPKDSKLAADIDGYFNRIWNNLDGDYTVDFEKYKDGSLSKKLLYRFQEWSGLCSF